MKKKEQTENIIVYQQEFDEQSYKKYLELFREDSIATNSEKEIKQVIEDNFNASETRERLFQEKQNDLLQQNQNTAIKLTNEISFICKNPIQNKLNKIHHFREKSIINYTQAIRIKQQNQNKQNKVNQNKWNPLFHLKIDRRQDPILPRKQTQKIKQNKVYQKQQTWRNDIVKKQILVQKLNYKNEATQLTFRPQIVAQKLASKPKILQQSILFR